MHDNQSHRKVGRCFVKTWEIRYQNSAKLRLVKLIEKDVPEIFRERASNGRGIYRLGS